MGTGSTCPRGHALEDNAVYCTVCWIRVEPEDPAIIAARRRRRRRVWFPLMGATAVALGVALGGFAATASKSVAPTAVVAAEASAAPTPMPVASDAPAAVAIDPLAATVADPVTPSQGPCVVEVSDQRVDCSTDNDQLAFTVCVPEVTGSVEVRMRATENVPWGDVSSDVTLGEQRDCAAGAIAADVVIDAANAGRDGAIWRLVVSDANGERLWRSRIVVDDAS